MFVSFISNTVTESINVHITETENQPTYMRAIEHRVRSVTSCEFKGVSLCRDHAIASRINGDRKSSFRLISTPKMLFTCP